MNFASSGLVVPHPESVESDEAKVLSFDGHDKFRFEDLLAEKNNIHKKSFVKIIRLTLSRVEYTAWKCRCLQMGGGCHPQA